jgi:outer membrane protein assembly factor BamB
MICLAILVAVICLLFPKVSAAQTVSNGSPGFSPVWSKNVGGLRSFSLSPHAHRLALLTVEGKLALWTAQDGNPVWSTGKQLSTNVLVSDGDGSVLTYNERSLLSRTATLRRADTGAVIWAKTFDKAVWCTAFNKSGTYAAIGTGDNTLHLVNIADDDNDTMTRLDGTPLSIAFAYDGKSVLVGQWSRSGVSCLDMGGKTMWRASGEMNRKYVISSVGEKFVTYVGSSNRHDKSPIIYVLHSATGKLLWAYDLDDSSYNAIAKSSATADLTGISFANPKIIPKGSYVEQRLSVVDRSGQMEWEKGGLFWPPILICLTPDQSGLIVYDGDRTLYRLDSQGRTVAHAVLSDTLRQWSVSDDETSLVTYTHDGQLSLLHIE